MKTDYKFGDKVRILDKLEDTTNYSVQKGDVGFVLNNSGNTFPVEVQFVGKTECFMYEELEFLNSNIEDE